MSRLLALLLAAVVVSGACFAQQAVPPLSARVTDTTATLSPSQRAALEQKLAQLEQRKGSQIALLIVATTAPEAIEQYALRVAEAWQLGRAGVDDGALLLIATDDRQLRIEVGYGLEGAIPDAIAKRVISEVITPLFRQGQFYQGIDAGIDRLIGLIDGEPLPEPTATPADGEFSGLFPLLFLLFPLLPALSRYLGRLPGALVSSAVMGGIGYLALGLIGGVMLGAFAFIVALNAGANGGLVQGQGSRRPRVRRRTGTGGFGGFGRGGFGGSGGGFGGGGGGFGGGGASGRW